MKRLLLTIFLMSGIWSTVRADSWGQRITNDSCDMWASFSGSTNNWLGNTTTGNSKWGNDGTNDNNKFWAANLFRNVQIPAGSIVDSAWNVGRVTTTSSDNTRVIIFFEAADDAAMLAGTAADLAGRTRTANLVYWNPFDATTGGNWYRSPNLAAPLNDVFGRPGWALGNDLLLMVRDSAGDPGAVRRVNDVANSPSNGDSILIFYHAGGGPGPTPTNYKGVLLRKQGN